MGRMENGEYMGGYHAVVCDADPKNPSSGVEYFIGRIDGQYRVLGCRPVSCRAYFSESSETRNPSEFVKLPNGKTSIADLVKGDALHLRSVQGKDIGDIVFDHRSR